MFKLYIKNLLKYIKNSMQYMGFGRFMENFLIGNFFLKLYLKVFV